MTSKLTREENVQAVFDLKAGYTLGLADVEILKRVARMALAAMDSEPVAFINGAWTLVYYRPPKESGLKIGDKLYRHAQQPVVLDSGREQFEEWFKFHDDGENSTEKLQRTNGGANYLYPDVDLAWIVWKDSRSALLQTAPAHLLPDKGHKGVTG